MNKFSKISLTLALSLMMFFSFILLASAVEPVDPYVGQAPMTEQEVEKTIDFLVEMAKDPQNQAKTMELMGKSGMDPMRFQYVNGKVGLALMEILGEDAGIDESQIPKSMIPTEAELALVKKHQSKLEKMGK